MICYKDTTFCADADKCPVKDGCMRYFSPAEQAKARRWWGSDDAPVAFGSMADHCERFKDAQAGVK